MKHLRLTALALPLLLILTCCGAANYTGDEANAVFAETTAAAAVAEEYSGEEAQWESDSAVSIGSTLSAGTVQSDASKLIYTGRLDLETTDLTAAVRALGDLVAQFDGYIETEERYQYSTWSDANYTVRIPSASYSDFLTALAQCEGCTVTYQNSSVEDVGEAYADIENRLETLQIKLDRLQELLRQAESVEDLITVENAISEVEYEIESLTGQKNHYDSLIDYSTIYLYLSEVKTLSEGVSPTLGQRISSAFQTGLTEFVQGCADLLVWVVGNLIGLLLVIALAVAALVVLRRRRRRRRAAKSPVPAPNQEGRATESEQN